VPRDYNIVVSVGGENRRGAFGGGNLYKNKTTLNKNAVGDLTNFNLSKVINIGLAFNTAQKANEFIGARTENRLRQRKINVAMTFAKYGIGLVINPTAGAIYVASDLAYRSAMYNVKIQKENREADYYRRLSGNNAFSGSRYRGDYVWHMKLI